MGEHLSGVCPGVLADVPGSIRARSVCFTRGRRKPAALVKEE